MQLPESEVHSDMRHGGDARSAAAAAPSQFCDATVRAKGAKLELPMSPKLAEV